MTQSGVFIALTISFATRSNFSVKSLPLRLRIITSLPVTYEIARYPSHLTSKSQSSPGGTSLTRVADMGA